MNKKFKLLDCTIRDGGYLNNWNFSDELVIKVFQTVSDAGYEYFEIGLKDNLNKYNDFTVGKFRKITDEQILQIKNKVNNPCKISVLVNQSTYNINEFVDRKDSPIDLVRIAFHKHEKVEAIKSAVKLQKLGYTVSLNAMGSISYNDSEIKELALMTVMNNINIFYIADSYGSMEYNKILHFKNVFVEMINSYIGNKNNQNYDNKIQFGCHAHNNLGTALDKSIKCIENDFNLIDTTIAGIGRGAGNLSCELLLSYLNKTKNSVSQNDCYVDDITINNIFKLSYYICHELNLNKNKILFHLSGYYNCHPNYIIKLLECNIRNFDMCLLFIVTISKSPNKGTFTKELFNEVLSKIR